MKLLACGAASLAIFISLLAAGDTDVQKLEKSLAGYFGEVVTVLKSVTDKTSAQDALPKFEKMYAKGQAYHKQVQELSQHAKKELFKSGGAVDKQREAMVKEVARLKLLPQGKEVVEVLKTSPLFKEALPFLENTADSKSKAAAAQIKVLTLAVQAYRVKNSTYPPTLEVLTKNEGGGPYLQGPQALIDPWGKAYQYDAAGPKNKGTVPDIWTITPQKQTVGNWTIKDKS